MIRLFEDHKKWAEKYGISLGEVRCPKCDKEFELCIPIATGTYRGLTIKEHGCSGGMPYRVVNTNQEFNNMLCGLAKDIKKSGPIS